MINRLAKWLSNRFLEYRIGLLEVRPGDMIVVKANMELSSERMKQIQEQATFMFGRQARVVVLDSRFDISIVGILSGQVTGSGGGTSESAGKIVTTTIGAG